MHASDCMLSPWPCVRLIAFSPLNHASMRSRSLTMRIVSIPSLPLQCVFLDADTLVVSNVDELFERPELSAAPDKGWPDCFNSVSVLFLPS